MQQVSPGAADHRAPLPENGELMLSLVAHRGAAMHWKGRGVGACCTWLQLSGMCLLSGCCSAEMCL
jgi:hypothetical protein